MICKSGERLLCLLKRLVLIIREEWDETLREAREIPMSNTGLIGKGVAPIVIDRAENGRGVIGVHEGAWTIINGLA